MTQGEARRRPALRRPLCLYLLHVPEAIGDGRMSATAIGDDDRDDDLVGAGSICVHGGWSMGSIVSVDVTHGYACAQA